MVRGILTLFSILGTLIVFGRNVCGEMEGSAMHMKSDNQTKNGAHDNQYPYCRKYGYMTRHGLTRKDICDKHNDCVNGDDECFCYEKDKTYLNGTCFRCLTRPDLILPLIKLCNGKFDCPDLSDECLCMRKEWNSTCNDRRWTVQNNTREETLRYGKSEEEVWLTWEDIWNDSQKRKQIRMSDDGDDRSSSYLSISCWTEDPETASQSVCELLKNRPHWIKKIDFPTIFGRENNEKYSFRIQYLEKSSNKKITNKTTRYFCSDLQTIFNICCNVTKTFGNKAKHSFYSSTIPRDKVCNGIFDCEDKSDECETSCMGEYADRKSMIKDESVLVVAWIISLTAVVCNVTVTVTSLKVLCRRERLTKEQKIVKFLFLSLAFSDLLVAMYTLAICITASTDNRLRQEYCKHDQEWRSGPKCTALGVMFVIGSEQSVFTMVLIALARVRAMRKPFSRPPIERIFVALGMAWIISILLAVVPLFPSLEDSFVTEIWFVNHELFGLMNKAHAENITESLLARFGNEFLDEREIGSWSLLRHMINKIQPYDNVAKFGFYSHHSVCLPAIFASPRLSSTYTWWMYTNIFIVINFLAFLAMFVGYIYIYKTRKSTENQVENVDTTNSLSTKLQWKIVLILLSDFCCWMPVCIASLVRLTEKEIPTSFYSPAALIMLPINSALNPFIYSGAPEYLWDKIRVLSMMIHQVCCQPLIRRFCTRT